MAHLTPDSALLTATAGVCLIYLELNRPGLILPGSLGLLLTLLATAALLHHALTLWALVLLAASVLVLTLNLYRFLPLWLLLAAIVALTTSLRFLVAPAEAPIHTIPALISGVLVGVLSATLSRIALRARRAKAIH
jgi:membrane-bound ClpP family serine protease